MSLTTIISSAYLLCLIAQIEGCILPLGMKDGRIKDNQITASEWLYRSTGSNHYQAKHARLDSKTPGGAWCSEGIHEPIDQYIQVDLLKDTKITAIATQGRTGSGKEYVETFQLQYQREGDQEFRKFNDSGSWKEFLANSHSSKTVKNSFARPIIARVLRIFPRGEEFAIYCMRLELYGCKWSHEISTLKSYTAPSGGEKDGVVLRDTSYDGLTQNGRQLSSGLGKLTDDLYGTKTSLLGSNGSPWVGYHTKDPEITFHFRKLKVLKQVMVHVDNNNNDIKVFLHLDIAISSDGVKFTDVKRYSTVSVQHQKIDAYPVVCSLGEVVARHLRMKFTKQDSKDWLLISEVVFMTETYPPKPVIPGTDSTAITTDNSKKVFTFPPTTDHTSLDTSVRAREKDSKSLSFPIILTIALVTIVLAIIVGIVIYKSYRKNQKQGGGGNHHHNSHDTSSSSGGSSSPRANSIASNHKQDSVSLLGGQPQDDRYMAYQHQQQQQHMKAPPPPHLINHQQQQLPLLTQNGLYFQPPVPMHPHQGIPVGSGYNQNMPIMS